MRGQREPGCKDTFQLQIYCGHHLGRAQASISEVYRLVSPFEDPVNPHRHFRCSVWVSWHRRTVEVRGSPLSLTGDISYEESHTAVPKGEYSIEVSAGFVSIQRSIKNGEVQAIPRSGLYGEV